MAKTRVFQIAKELNISHTDILNYLKSKDVEISSHMSPVDKEIQKMIMDEFAKDKEEVDRFRKERVRREIHDTRLKAQQQTTKKLKLLSLSEQRELEKKEMNYFFEYSDIIDLKLNYNETDAKAFDNLSTDTQFLGTSIEKKLNENVLLSLSSDLDLKNNYSPLKQVIKLSLFDECSKLDISYIDERFNDNYNTKPSETINISLSMDYLGFFGYEQKSNVFFEKTGKFNYGD